MVAGPVATLVGISVTDCLEVSTTSPATHVLVSVVDSVGAAFDAPGFAFGVGRFVADDPPLRSVTVQPVKPNWASFDSASLVAAALPRQLELRPLT